ncbi:MAG TPA: SDR family NAD(P)-dependent oxidoreductase [Solirubrobacteraceae bacterium]|nr:SDR family NAD(P)-dependent oxidoreductase [Solirubrobacteraceae bacterium]
MPAVLITGASRGIGRASALWLAARGWDVLAAVRDLASAPAAPGPPPAGGPVASPSGTITPVALDITDPDQIQSLDAALPAHLDAVVNNAGIVVAGPVEAVGTDALRRQFEVNVIGQAAVTGAVLPRLRASRGRVVFVSSVSGRIATPMFGPYSASKFALEAMADALRMEVAPWGIRVALVEPAQTDTDMWQHAEAELDRAVAALDPAHRTLYTRHIEGFRRTIPRSMKVASPADGVAGAIERALTDRRPRARYVVGRAARIQAVLGELTPTPLRDRMLSLGTGVPRRVS